MQFLLTGATGFIGSYLRSILLKEGHYLTVLTRSPEKYSGEKADNQRFLPLDTELISEMDRADVVINLAGENLFGRRWTREFKDRVYKSRIETTRALTLAIGAASTPPQLLISASGVNFYSDAGSKPIDESSPGGDDFLARLCRDWEEEAMQARPHGVRVATPRIGLALQEDGGVLEKMKLPFRLFVGGPIGNGRQYMPWIHMNDLCSALLFPVENESLQGPYNACSPNAVTMNELASLVGKVMNRPSFFRVPEPLLRLVLGEAAAPVLSSLRVKPGKLLDSGFRFEFEDLEEALADLL